MAVMRNGSSAGYTGLSTDTKPDKSTSLLRCRHDDKASRNGHTVRRCR